MKRLPIFTLLLLLVSIFKSQNETNQWFFGNKAGLDFNSSPPTLLLNSAMNASVACASAADAIGNLLFYTSGDTIWNRLHQVMANGAGINGDPNFTQSSLILKQPGSDSLYYVFTRNGQNGISSLNYSIIDMSAAAGMGSVTVKNYSVYSGTYSENLTATKHCNGNDYWVIIANTNFLFTNERSFRAYKLTSNGMSSNAVLSNFTTQLAVSHIEKGAIKVSPTGKKIGLANYSHNSRSFELANFDNSSGQVTNPLLLGYGYGYGCEFSPDGSKFYGSELGFIDVLYQWDISLNSDSLINASQTVLGTVIGELQLAPDGKIYGAQYNQTFLSVINNPNLAGNLCNFVYNGQSLGTDTSKLGLPNFPGSFFNTTPSLTITSTGGLSMCTGETKTLSVSGASSYSWNGGISGASLVISPNISTTYSVIGTTSSGCHYEATTTITVSNCVGLIENKISYFELYPNPAQNTLHIKYAALTLEEFNHFKIYNNLGQIVKEELVFPKTNSNSIDISELENGIYTLVFLNSKNEQLVKRLVVAR